eukprot:8101912-Alexandrium_andersonii.AAC.1
MAKDFADCRLTDCGLEPPNSRFRDLGPPRGSFSWADSESAREAAQNAPLGSFEDQFRGRSWARAVPGLKA